MWLAPETAMRTDRVVVRSQTVRHDLCFLECVEELAEPLFFFGCH